MKRIFVDIETAPLLVCSWSIGRKISISHENIVRERQIICICWKEEGKSRIHSLQWDNAGDDKKMLLEFIQVLDSADEIVGHNLKRFDLPWIKARCVFHRIPTLPVYRVFDTLTVARANFKFVSNRLDYLGKFLGARGKTETGFGLWKAVVLEKSTSALAKMVRYCKNDIRILEFVYSRLAPEVPVKVHAAVLAGGESWHCPRCQSVKVYATKTRVTASGTKQHQFQCNYCGGYYTTGVKAFEAYVEAIKKKK